MSKRLVLFCLFYDRIDETQREYGSEPFYRTVQILQCWTDIPNYKDAKILSMLSEILWQVVGLRHDSLCMISESVIYVYSVSDPSIPC